MEDEEWYDEFGNYVGPETQEPHLAHYDEEEEEEEEGVESVGVSRAVSVHGAVGAADTQSVVLYHDKQYYPDASDVYGPGTEARVELEDTQPLETPIVAPVKEKRFEHVEVGDTLPETTWEWSYFTKMMDHPNLVRSLAVIGHLHHGKTTLMDQLVRETHRTKWTESAVQKRYLDARFDEQARGLSIKAKPISLILPSLRSKSHLLHFIDTPGHPNFSDEMEAALRLVDGVCLVVDVIESVMMQTQRGIEAAVKEGLPIVLVLNKIDRLIVELRLPPEDCYLKIRHCINEVNLILKKAIALSPFHSFDDLKLSPSRGNVVFASAKYSWLFSLESFVLHKYSEGKSRNQVNKLVSQLWGDYFFNAETGKISSDSKSGGRTYVEFILKPIYKIFSHCLGQDPDDFSLFAKAIDLKLSKSEIHTNPDELLRITLSRFFVNSGGLVNAIVRTIPDSQQSANRRLQYLYTAESQAISLGNLANSDPAGNLLVQVTKLFPRPDGSALDAFCRIWNGTLKAHSEVQCLREKYTLDDPEDMSLGSIGSIWIYQGRYRVQVNQAGPGNLVLIEGLDDAIAKVATLTTGSCNISILRNLTFNTSALMKIAIEPLVPSELPKMLDGLRRISQTYPLANTRVEESGEHIIIGTGEIYLDSIMHDLRIMFADIEIKVSDPSAMFAETVVETSAIKCRAETPNKFNSITMIAEPLDPGLDRAIERGTFVDLDEKQVSQVLRNDFNWDILASRSLWAFGPNDVGPNVLLNDTLPEEVKRDLLEDVRPSLVQGFKWACREGPLCEEPIRSVKFKLIEAQISDLLMQRSPGQIIPSVRRASYSSFLTAAPRLVEPIYFVQIQTPSDCIASINKVLTRRRGHVTLESPKPGTPMHILHALVPLMDSFGLESDVRTRTNGMAFCLSTFDHWDLVPGDPFDKSIPIRPLEPSPPLGLAREFMIKTRRRKGLSEDVSVVKYLDDPRALEDAYDTVNV
jgi:U5 small nuclear ribonucleoprotein component